MQSNMRGDYIESNGCKRTVYRVIVAKDIVLMPLMT